MSPYYCIFNIKLNFFFSIYKIKQLDNLKQTDKNGMSALHYASMNGHKEIVKYLVERGLFIKTYIFISYLHYLSTIIYLQYQFHS